MGEHVMNHVELDADEPEKFSLRRQVAIGRGRLAPIHYIEDYRASSTKVHMEADDYASPGDAWRGPAPSDRERAHRPVEYAFSPQYVSDLLFPAQRMQQTLDRLSIPSVESLGIAEQAGAAMQKALSPQNVSGLTRSAQRVQQTLDGLRIPMVVPLGIAEQALAALRNQQGNLERAASAMMRLTDPSYVPGVGGGSEHRTDTPITPTVTESISMQIAPVSSVFERIREIADLEEGWNSYGARKTTPVAVAEAGQLLMRSLDVSVYEHGVAVDVAPLSDGGVVIEWDSPVRRFQVWIHGDGSRSGVIVEVQDEQDVDWRDMFDVTDAEVVVELQKLVEVSDHA